MKTLITSFLFLALVSTASAKDRTYDCQVKMKTEQVLLEAGTDSVDTAPNKVEADGSHRLVEQEFDAKPELTLHFNKRKPRAEASGMVRLTGSKHRFEFSLADRNGGVQSVSKRLTDADNRTVEITITLDCSKKKI